MNIEKISKDKEMQYNLFRINCIWTICILAFLLLLAIAFIATCRMVDGSGLSKYLSFASVLLSVVLSVFAIMFTYTSNASIEHRFNRIDEISKDMENATKLIDAISKDLESATKLMGSTSDQLNNNIGEILAKIKDVSDKLNKNDGTADYSKAANNNLCINGKTISNDSESSEVPTKN